MEDDGMRRMTAVRGDALLTILVKRERGTVSMIVTVKTPDGRCVVTTCASTPSISPRPSIPTTPCHLASAPVTTAVIGSATKTITGVEMAMWDVCTMRTVMMDTTARLTWISPPAMSWTSVT